LTNPTLSLDKIFTQQHIHRRKLERVFQAEIGVSPNKVKLLYRIKQARQMIKRFPDKPLADIALEVGFFDQAHFNRQFQQVTGKTPGQYRLNKMSQKYNLAKD